MRPALLPKIGFLILCLISFSARADEYSSDPTVHIQLKSYQKVDGTYYFQLYFPDLPANQQPKLKHMGDPVGYKNFVIGTFNVSIFKTSVGGGPPQQVDASTLDIYDVKAGRKVVLTYHAPEPAPAPALVQPQ